MNTVKLHNGHASRRVVQIGVLGAFGLFAVTAQAGPETNIWGLPAGAVRVVSPQQAKAAAARIEGKRADQSQRSPARDLGRAFNAMRREGVSTRGIMSTIRAYSLPKIMERAASADRRGRRAERPWDTATLGRMFHKVRHFFPEIADVTIDTQPQALAKGLLQTNGVFKATVRLKGGGAFETSLQAFSGASHLVPASNKEMAHALYGILGQALASQPPTAIPTAAPAMMPK